MKGPTKRQIREEKARRETRNLKFILGGMSLLLGVPLYWGLSLPAAIAVHLVLVICYLKYTAYLGDLNLEAWVPISIVSVLMAILFPLFSRVQERL